MKANFFIYPLTGSQRAMIYRALSVYYSYLDVDSPLDFEKSKECIILKEMFGIGCDSYLHDVILDHNGNTQSDR